MATQILRPNAVIQNGTSVFLTGSGTPTLLGVMSDGSDASNAIRSGTNPAFFNDSAISSIYPVLAFQDATGLIPAGRFIQKVEVFHRGRYDPSVSGGSSASTWRYSDNTEFAGFSKSHFSGTTGIKQLVQSSTSATRVFGATKGNWTHALIDGMKVAFAGDGGVSQDGREVYDLWMQVTYTDLFPAPTMFHPLDGTVLSSSTPSLQGIQSAVATGQKGRLEFQLAQDSGFTVDVRTLLTTTNIISGTVDLFWPTGQPPLVQGSWYVRCRVLDEYGNYGPYGVAKSFTVAHPPTTTNLHPNSGEYRLAGPVAFDWAFSDPWAGDSERAYQIIIERNVDGTVVLDTGKIVSTAMSATITLTGDEDSQLRFKVNNWDSDDVQNTLDAPYGVFYYGARPTVALTSPISGGTVDNPAPTFTWLFTTGGGTRVQKSAQITVKNAVTGAVMASGSVAGTETSWFMPYAVLQNGGAYQVEIVVTDTANMTNTTGVIFFTAVWTPPTPSTLTLATTAYQTLGCVELVWLVTIDPAFVSQRIYRLTPSQSPIDLEDTEGNFVGATWELIYETPNGLQRYFRDYTAPSGYNTSYRVVQVVNRFGSLIEADSPSKPLTVPKSESYWLIDPENDTHNVKLRVTTDSFHDEIETNIQNLIGRGRHVSYGDDYGVVGSLSAQVYDQQGLTARQNRLILKQLKERRRAMWLVTPFGDVWLVATGDMNIERIAGTGYSEYFTLSFDYSEVGE